MAENRYVGSYPVIGIRPTIDGRRGALKVRESLEEQTMNMANSAAKLFEENLRYEIKGDGYAEKLVAGATEYDIDCVFIIKESISVAKLVPGLDYSKAGIVTQRNMATSVPGIYAAGDCTGRPYQLAKAAGEGNVAALSACEYIDKKEK